MSFFLFTSPATTTTTRRALRRASSTERLFFSSRVRDSFLRVSLSLLFLSLALSLNFPKRGVEFTTDAHHRQSLSLSLSLESMSVIARCATFVATKTSLKQQFAVNTRSSATKIVRYALKERKRWMSTFDHSARDCFFFVFFWEFELKKREKMAGKRLRTPLFFLSKDYLWRRRRFSSSSSWRRYYEY